MTRLQKKCLIGVAGTHLMLVVLLLCSGFFKPTPKPDDSQVLDVIPANIIEAAFRSGVRGAQAPPPTPIVPPQPQPQQTPTPPVPTPPKPAEPVKPVEPVQQPQKIQPEDVKPVVHADPTPPKPHKVDVDLTPVVRKTTTQPDKSAEEAKEAAKQAAKEAKEAKRLQQERERAFRNAASSIRNNKSSSTTVEMSGDSSAAYADYASVVKTVYTAAWNLPDTSASDDTNVKVSVTISSDGRVTEAHIVDRSGDSSVDGSVQKTLDRVRQIEPFPPGSTDRERTYIIIFNLKAKRMLG